MQKLPQQTAEDSPFFNLLADADEIRIREIDEENGKDSRAFHVYIKSPPPAPKVQSPPAHDWEYLRKSAHLLLEHQDYILARNLYSFLLQHDLKDREALRGLGICLFRLGEVVSSRKCFRALVELYHCEEAHYWLGTGYLSESEDLLASQHLEKVGTADPLPAELQFDFFKSYGNCLTRLGQLDRAESMYLKALQLQPTSDVIQVNLGTLLMQRRQWKQAADRFNRAIEVNPQSARGYCGLGLSAIALGETSKAIQYFHQSLDLDAHNLVALHQLLEYATEAEHFPTLKGRLNNFLEKHPTHADSHYALAAILFKEGAWKACEVTLNRALESDPSHARALKLRSDLSALVRSHDSK